MITQAPRTMDEIRRVLKNLTQNDRARNRYHSDPVYKDKILKAGQRYVDGNRRKCRVSWRKRSLKYNYGLTVEQYERMFQQQSGECALCHRPPKMGKRLHVDHDHETGVVRGLLCNMCNRTIGIIEASLNLSEIEMYLKRGIR